ncbi:MAG: hypothetical protein IT523_11910 [Burkholderiales bacterium]|nr:hypothetical protein [Burkholderiales bacterium]
MFRKIANAIFLLGLAPWGIMFMFSAMLFDAPGSENSPLTNGLFYSIASYPILVFVGFFVSNGFSVLKDEHRWRGYFAFLPLVSLVFTIAFMVALEQFCGGRLSCQL